MAKGYIVVDMPKSCGYCKYSVIYKSNGAYWCQIMRKEVDDAPKPDWCPIKEIPAKVYHENYCDAGRYDKGWNDLRAEMFGEEK